MNIIGIYGCCGWKPEDAWLHGAGASLWQDAAHRGSVSQERLSRIKYDGAFPAGAVDYLLSDNRLSRDDIHQVVYVDNAWSIAKKALIINELKRHFARAQIEFIGHHQAHACAVFYTSPFEEASILSLDGAGTFWNSTRETGLYALGEGDRITVLYHALPGIVDHDTFVLGDTFAGVAQYIYWRLRPREFAEMNVHLRPETTPGKIMGLAAYGNPQAVKAGSLFSIVDDSFYFPRFSATGLHIPAISNFCSNHVLRGYSPEDLAAWLQAEFTGILVEYFRKLPARFKSRNLCLAGGCALNVIANRALKEMPEVDDVWVFPATNDQGLCYGGALSRVIALFGRKNIDLGENLASTGKKYSEEAVLRELEQDFDYRRLEREELSRITAGELAAGSIIGWFQGGAEFGPRALGFRSILADPRRPDIKDTLNTKVKHREEWRPYAPVVLAEHASEWFDVTGSRLERFMLMNAKVLKPGAPGITHADGSARVQVVTEQDNPRLHSLLRAFRAETGVPVLLNTSFNLGGEPIVESPKDALDTLRRSRLDGLCIENFFVKKS
jgi:carbamoyltransferase